MHGKRSTWKWLAALIGVAMVGSWCPEALGQAETEQAQAEKETRLQPLKSAPLEVLSRKHVEQKPELPEDGTSMIAKWPELIGGMRSLVQEIQYPASCRERGVQGRVIVTFAVNEHGRVEDAVVKEGIGRGCDKEALRVIRQARFKPGIGLDGKPIRVEMSVPITFKLKTSTRIFNIQTR